MNQIGESDLSTWQLYTYDGILLLVFVYLIAFRYVRSQAKCYLACLFFSGMVTDFSNLLFGGRLLANVFQITMLVWGVHMSLQTHFSLHIQKYKRALELFLMYGTYFFVCTFAVHHDSIILVFSQFAKLLIPICFLFVMLELEQNGEKENMFWVFWELVVLQIFFSVLKVALIGGYMEGWVGSLSGVKGGGMGTTIPLLGLFLFALKTDFRVSNIYDILFLSGMLLIGFLTGKRAVWVEFPVLYMFLGLYVYRRSFANKLVILAIVFPLMIYVALRLSPSLNPEGKVGGSFDTEYAMNYGLKYSAGIDEYHEGIQSGTGRLGAVAWMWQRLGNLDKKALLGSGLEYMVYADHDDYSNQAYYQGIRGRGSITGVVSTFLTLGAMGVALFLAFAISLLRQNKSRFGLAILLTALFDYIFYNATILTTTPLLTLTLFLGLFSEEEVTEPNGYFERENKLIMQ